MGTNQLGHIMKSPLCWWAGLSAGAYSHMANLSILAGQRPLSSTHPRPVPRVWNQIQTPMAAEVWDAYLTSHPDRAYAEYLTEGIQAGFRIGFRYGEVVCRSSTSNMPSATVHPEVVSNFLTAELRAGRVLGPVDSELQSSIHTNRCAGDLLTWCLRVTNLVDGG